MTNNAPALPAYSDEALAGRSLEQLIDLMIRDEDRVPRNVIDQCAARGEEMVEQLRARLDNDHAWHPVPLNQWWLRLHAVMILGLIPSESAGLFLVQLMRCMALAEDDNLQDWFAGHWPWLFRNKPRPAVEAVRALCSDRTLDWYIRCQAADVVIDAAACDGDGALDRALAWLADSTADESEDWNFRLSAGNTLLDFPRERHRKLLADLAQRQAKFAAKQLWPSMHFSPEDVEKAYVSGVRNQPDWERFKNPWKFYAPGAIARRQDRWAEEYPDDPEADSLFDEPQAPYVRPIEKVGRNDPCPCGSGKKYKKCCLLKEQA